MIITIKLHSQNENIHSTSNSQEAQNPNEPSSNVMALIPEQPQKYSRTYIKTAFMTNNTAYKHPKPKKKDDRHMYSNWNLPIEM
jgi:hypothetical protein